MRGYTPNPRSPGQWTDYFTKNMHVIVPMMQCRETYIDVERFDVPELGTSGDPDLLVTLKNGKQFYIKYIMENRVFWPLDLPMLCYPPVKGVIGAFWIAKDEFAFKNIYS